MNTAHLNAVHKYLACKDGSKGEGVASERRGEPSSPSIVVTCADIEVRCALIGIIIPFNTWHIGGVGEAFGEYINDKQH